MIVDDEALTGALEDAGLSPYQADAYVTLLSLGTATATTLAEESDVPDPRIYDVLRDLADRGYVETYQQDSLTARARDPEAVLEDLRSRSKRYIHAAEAIEDRWNAPPITDHEVSIVQRRETVLERARSVIEGAEDIVDVAGSRSQVAALAGAIETAATNDVAVRVAVCGDDRPDSDLLGGPALEVRASARPGRLVVVADREDTCFAPEEDGPHEYGVLVSDPAYAEVLDWYFLTGVWADADPVAGPPASGLAETYVDVHECVRDLAAAGGEGEVTVRVEGHDTASGERVVRHGEVEEINAPTADGPPPFTSLAEAAGFTLRTTDGPVDIRTRNAVEGVAAQRIHVEDGPGYRSD